MTDTTSAGFAHSREGALLAAVHLSRRAGFTAPPAAREATVKRQFVPDENRDRLLALLRAEAANPGPTGERNAQIGYVHRSYRSDQAVISLVLLNPGLGSSRSTAITHTLLWRDGDWQMVAPPGGSWFSVSTPGDGITGMVSWVER